MSLGSSTWRREGMCLLGEQRSLSEWVQETHRPVSLNDQIAGPGSAPDVDRWVCWTPTDHITPVAPVLAAPEGLPAKTQEPGSDGLEPGRKSLGCLHFRELAQASEVGTDCIFPHRSPADHTHFLAPSSSPETVPFEAGTMCGLMCEMGPVFWSHRG